MFELTNLTKSERLRSNLDFVLEARVAYPLDLETDEGIHHQVITEVNGSYFPVHPDKLPVHPTP